MKIATISKIMFFCIMFLTINFNIKSEEFNKSHKMNKMPKLAASSGFSYYLTFHPCYMSATDSANSVSIYVVSYSEGKVTLEIPALKITREQKLIPNNITEFKLTPQEAFAYLRLSTDTVSYEQVYYGRAIHIKSEVEIFCNGVVKFNGSSEGYNALPEIELGSNYQVATYNSSTQPAYISIIGYYDNTKVDFRLGGSGYTIKQDGDTLHYGEIIRRTLNEGDVWLIPGIGLQNDLTGSVITSTKPCAVVSGNYSAGVTKKTSTKNYLIEQELPSNLWGTKYFVSPILSRKNFSIIKIFAEKPYTQIYVDDAPMWTITSPSGILNVGYIEARAGTGSTPRPVVIRSDSGFPINVVQFNPSNEDGQTALNIPFKMQLVPFERFTNELFFATPCIIGDTTFSDNYINIVFKGNHEGGISDDMQLGEVDNNQFHWTSLYSYSNTPGTVFNYYTSDEDGRRYFSKTMRLNKNGVYSLKSNDLFTVTMYGVGKNGIYGFPITNKYYNLASQDTLAPYVEFQECECCGFVTGKVFDEPRTDAENRSNLATVYMHPISFNYTLKVEPFTVGVDSSTNWSLIINDKTVNAYAHLVFLDMAGNRKDTIIHFETNLATILESKADFGTYISVNPPKIITNTFTLKNTTGNYIDSNKFSIYIILDSRMNDNKPNDINTYQNFDLIDVEGKNLAPLQNDKEIKFDVKFTGNKFGNFRDSIGVLVISKTTGDTCAVIYFTELTATMGQAYFIADDYTFDNQKVNTRSNTFTLKISNPKTSSYSSDLPISISGFTFDGDLVGHIGSGQIFEVDGLQSLSESKPMILDPGKDHQFKVSFKPDSVRHYESKMSFIVKAVNCSDIVNLPDIVTILNGTGEPITSVHEDVIGKDIVSILPNPAKDYIYIQPSEGSDILIFDMLGVNLSPAGGGIKGGGRIDISNLSPGMYFIKIGNRVEKFVKI